MRRTLLVALLVLGLAHGTRAEEPSTEVLERALHAMAYGASVRFGFATAKRASGKSTPFIEAVIAAPDTQIEQVYAKVLGPHISQADAEFLLTFYTSPAGIQLVADQSSDPSNPNPPLKLTAPQLQEAREFSGSQQVRRFRQATEDPALQQELGRQLKATLLK